MVHESGKIKKILVRCPNWVGDIIMAAPLYDCLRLNFPDAQIACIIRKYAAGIVKDGPWFDEIIATDDKKWGGFWALRQWVHQFQPDMAVVLPNSLRSTLPIRLAGVKKVYGYRRGGRSWLLAGGPAPTRENGHIKALPMNDYYLEIGRWLGLRPPLNGRSRLYINDQTQRQAEVLLDHYGVGKDELLIGLNPGASFGSSKCWPTAYFARLAELLRNQFGGKLILFSGPGEEQIAAAIIRESKTAIIDTTADKVDLNLLKPLIKRCDLLVTNDTGPRHYAVAFEVPAVVIMGPTNPNYTASNLETTEVVRVDLECSPCHKKVCPTKHECMVGITPEKVLESCKRLMNKRKPNL